MTAHDDTARDTANARADALLAMHARLETITAERDELAAKLARVEDALNTWRFVDMRRAATLRRVLRGNP
jgi:hypothetical protein